MILTAKPDVNRPREANNSFLLQDGMQAHATICVTSHSPDPDVFAAS